jgi:hypothetical protein
MLDDIVSLEVAPLVNSIHQKTGQDLAGFYTVILLIDIKFILWIIMRVSKDMLTGLGWVTIR